MKKYLLICLTGLFLASSCGGQQAPAQNIPGNEIHLTEAYLNPRTVLLSELVDSVSFIALENNGINVSSIQLLRFSDYCIFAYDKFFDWNGKYLGTIGRPGRGPLEIPWPVSDAVYTDGYFYSMSSKLLQYDLTGKATGKVRNFYVDMSMDGKGMLRNSAGFIPAGENFIVYEYPDSVYFIDRDFEIIGSRSVFEVNFPPFTKVADTYTSSYGDTAVFYNFMNDTIFHASNTRFEPKWIVRFSEELRPANDLFIEMRQLAMDAVSSGNIENSELRRRSKGKQIVTAVYETDDYLFLPMKELAFFMEVKPDPYLAYFVKSTGETIRVQGNGFEDDLLGLDYFFQNGALSTTR